MGVNVYCKNNYIQISEVRHGRTKVWHDLADAMLEMRVIVKLARQYIFVFRQDLFEFSSEDTRAEFLRMKLELQGS
jgi:hypothetical protein